MNLPKAIEILQTQVLWDSHSFNEERPKAIRLGIEALKRVKAYKEAHKGLHYELMLGETED